MFKYHSSTERINTPNDITKPTWIDLTLLTSSMRYFRFYFIRHLFYTQFVTHNKYGRTYTNTYVCTYIEDILSALKQHYRQTQNQCGLKNASKNFIIR